jgi:hypothetical protein
MRSQRVSPAFRYTLLWVLGSLAIVVAALTMLPAAFLDGVYVPSNPDAFYHARRILDVVMTGAGVVQFDAQVHYPDGSWIPWPWGFDTFMAMIVGWFGPYPSEAAAAAVLMNLPVAAAPIAVALFVWLGRQLELSFPSALVATVAFAALPLVFLAFAVGNVDHHFAELLWALLMLCGGIAFLRAASVVSAVGLGVILGSAVAVHNGLFILQLPVVAVFAWRWLRNEPLPPRRAVIAFAATLVAVTLLVSVESEPWRRGAFEFYTLSWFHSYVALCTAAILVLFAFVRFSARALLCVALIASGAALPLLRAAGLGARFVSGDLELLRDVTEAMSPYELYALFGPAQSTRLFSWLMWLALPALLVNGYWVVRVREPGRQLFSVAAVLLLALMQLQYRFGVLGIVPLLMTLALLVDAARRRWPTHARLHVAGAALGMFVALLPTREVWTTPRAAGGNPFYADMQPGLMRLRDACARRPGVVLAGIDDGHWVRYHTQCSVIGNVFLLTEDDARKRREVETLLAMPAERLRAERPDIAYVFIHGELELYVPVMADGSHGQGVLRWKTATLPALMRELLAAEPTLQGYTEVWATYLPDGQVLGRVLEID